MDKIVVKNLETLHIVVNSVVEQTVEHVFLSLISIIHNKIAAATNHKQIPLGDFLDMSKAISSLSHIIIH